MKNVMGLIGLMILLAVMAGCQSSEPSEAAEAYIDHHEIIDQEEKAGLLPASDEIFFTSNRDNESAEAASTYIDRQEYLNLPEGRYAISGEGGGNVEVYDSNDNLLIGDYIGRFSPSLSVDLKEDYTVKVDGFVQVFVEPTETKMQTELTSGIWEVGLDVPAGEYTLTTNKGMGYFIIFDPENHHQVYELIGSQYSPTTSQVTLKEGQKIRVTGVNKVILSDVKNTKE